MFGRRGSTEKAGRGSAGRGYGGSTVCTCPGCGHSEPHKRGVPCSLTKCPKCKERMVGARCS